MEYLKFSYEFLYSLRNNDRSFIGELRLSDTLNRPSVLLNGSANVFTQASIGVTFDPRESDDSKFDSEVELRFNLSLLI